MSKLLYIKADAKPDNTSRTFEISDRFIHAYQTKNPNDEIITLDLYKEGIGFLTADDVMRHGQPAAGRNDPVMKYAFQFVEADKYVFAEPMWNLSIPAILKAYIDYVTVSGITFKYTAQGPVGLCTGKKALHITTRGGGYSQGPSAAYEMGDRYLRTVIGFIGVTDFATVAAENLDVMGTDVALVLKEAKEKASEIANHF
jgi:FMN-dependent NADH-azoreductase